MNLVDSVVKVVTNASIIGAIVATIGTILLGYWLRKTNRLKEGAVKSLTTVTMTVALPLLAFNSFMTPLNQKTLQQGMSVLIWGLLIYIILIVTMPWLYAKYGKDERDVLGVLTSFGSTTFFGMPIVGAVYGAKGVMYASIFNIGYRIFLYSYAYIKMSGQQLKGEHIKKMLLNPIVVATFLGLFLWLIQNAAPQVTAMVTDSKTGQASLQHVAFFRLDATMPWLYSWFKMMAALASPLAWLAIGGNLAQMSFGEALKNKTAWYYSFNKVIIVPIIMIVLTVITSAMGILPVDHIALATMVIMMATPVATVAVNYAMAFNRQSLLASNTSLISTILATIFIPVWIIAVQLLGDLPLFK
ncbi:AEC family transporter [Fructobacillus sp. M1-13]|uniref:AEC family transporter n=1 Tax=Fructobacillus papyriferae TaxID=2713171 RepID=A0ABS5QS37_9LACO|nr:AEC family transporter [Fructobacillus papyriferae]MBS9335285.1 AEC family transporter [Fructobacillus papyriferae]MCD2159046.1 AEC family transporter [Fructobacillus papyriferae]